MMQQKVIDAIDLETRKKIAAMMFKKAVDTFVEQMKQFAKSVVEVFTPLIKQLTNFVRWINRVQEVYLQDRVMISSWENEGGAVHG